VSKALVAAALLALGGVCLLQQDTTAMAVPASAGPTGLATPAIADTMALRRGRTANRRVAVRHRAATVRARGVASGHRRVAVRTRQAAVQPRAVATRKARVATPARKPRVAVAPRSKPVATPKRTAVAVNSTEVVRPVRPWVQQPYYGSRFDGVVLGTIVAANAVPTPPSVDVCWYWSNSARTRGYWDFCQ
jgi:hypothetical protein